MRRIAAAVVLIAWLHGGASADPAADGAAVPAAATAATTATTATTASGDGDAVPLPDFAPGTPPEAPRPARRSNKLRAALTLGGIYAAFSGWSYLAWYQQPVHEFRATGDPSDGELFQWFAVNTYAGGADKLGHAWSTMGLARVGTELLHQWGGYSKLEASIIGTAASEALFLAVEIVDGYHYTFSSGDLAFNTAGALLAFAQSNYPRFDDLVDFRVEYIPSAAYRRLAAEGDVDYAEDYSGQTYYLSLHLGAIPVIRETRHGGWSRFVDVSAGFRTRGYKPDPPWKVTEELPDYEMSQELFLGLSLNVQGVFDYLLETRAPRIRKLTHGLFELVSVPFTTLPVVDGSRSPSPLAPSPL